MRKTSVSRHYWRCQFWHRCWDNQRLPVQPGLTIVLVWSLIQQSYQWYRCLHFERICQLHCLMLYWIRRKMLLVVLFLALHCDWLCSLKIRTFSSLLSKMTQLETVCVVKFGNFNNALAASSSPSPERIHQQTSKNQSRALRRHGQNSAFWITWAQSFSTFTILCSFVARMKTFVSPGNAICCSCISVAGIIFLVSIMDGTILNDYDCLCKYGHDLNHGHYSRLVQTCG
jgi:hypothetical protein